ncbi:MAG: methyltransferase domain-containing protein [candidate division WOR-3 bacterium]|nr:methyltransferase domain-containing protein [candidate division WOR-3 bacterium]
MKLLDLYRRFLRDDTGRLRAVKGTFAFLKTGVYYYLLKRRITGRDYREAYDAASATYLRWTERMGKHTQKIVKLEYLNPKQGRVEVLDLACGSGCITKKLLERWEAGGELRVTAVDFSLGMLSCARKAINDPRVRFVASEGAEFLKRQKPGTYDAVFFGWALPYFDHAELIPLLYRSLKPGGLAFLISNSKGTLAEMENIFIELMAEHPVEVNKVLDVSFRLPDGERGLSDWFARQGFAVLESGEGEEEVYFDDPRELYRWLCETGALAGAGRIFKDKGIMENAVVEKIRRRRGTGRRYMINHRFVYGIFRKAE